MKTRSSYNKHTYVEHENKDTEMVFTFSDRMSTITVIIENRNFEEDAKQNTEFWLGRVTSTDAISTGSRFAIMALGTFGGQMVSENDDTKNLVVRIKG